MQRIEFVNKFSVWSWLRVRFVGLWSAMLVRLSLVTTGIFVFAMAVFLTEFPAHAIIFVAGLSFVGGMWVLCVGGLIVRALFEYKGRNQGTKSTVHYVDDRGWGFESETQKGFFSWETFMSFKETRREFLLIDWMHYAVPILKKGMTGEVVRAIREVLRAAPVKRKFLL